VAEGTDAGKLLDEMKPTLDAALARTGGQGSRAADLLAHIGWWHWLNEKIAHREFERAAERDLREALRLDPSNGYAHGMLGNLLMQTGGRTAEALSHFRQAAEMKKDRRFVRQLQLGALIYPRDGDSRAALIAVANEMRREGEALDDRQKGRILAAYSPTVNTFEELTQALGAVGPSDALATYEWLAGDRPDRAVERDFVRALLLKIDGRRGEARAAFAALRGELTRRGYDGRIVQHVERALAELNFTGNR
jgi:tetratricopeptide (TPR) repeat protein